MQSNYDPSRMSFKELVHYGQDFNDPWVKRCVSIVEDIQKFYPEYVVEHAIDIE